MESLDSISNLASLLYFLTSPDRISQQSVDNIKYLLYAFNCVYLTRFHDTIDDFARQQGTKYIFDLDTYRKLEEYYTSKIIDNSEYEILPHALYELDRLVFNYGSAEAFKAFCALESIRDLEGKDINNVTIHTFVPKEFPFDDLSSLGIVESALPVLGEKSDLQELLQGLESKKKEKEDDLEEFKSVDFVDTMHEVRNHIKHIKDYLNCYILLHGTQGKNIFRTLIMEHVLGPKEEPDSIDAMDVDTREAYLEDLIEKNIEAIEHLDHKINLVTLFKEIGDYYLCSFILVTILNAITLLPNAVAASQYGEQVMNSFIYYMIAMAGEYNGKYIEKCYQIAIRVYDSVNVKNWDNFLRGFSRKNIDFTMILNKNRIPESEISKITPPSIKDFFEKTESDEEEEDEEDEEEEEEVKEPSEGEDISMI